MNSTRFAIAGFGSVCRGLTRCQTNQSPGNSGFPAMPAEARRESARYDISEDLKISFDPAHQ